MRDVFAFRAQSMSTDTNDAHPLRLPAKQPNNDQRQGDERQAKRQQAQLPAKEAWVVGRAGRIAVSMTAQ